VSIIDGRSYTEIVPGRLAVMGRPGMYNPLAQDLAFLRRQGIGAVVSLTGMPLDDAELGRAELDCLHEAVPDFAPPEPEQLDRILDYILEHNRAGRSVLVHCGAGLGRSGTVAAAFLVHGGMGATEAIARVRELRPYSVETREQEQAVEDYEKRLRGK
jgi:atypical dual specificity phosphatase